MDTGFPPPSQPISPEAYLPVLFWANPYQMIHRSVTQENWNDIYFCSSNNGAAISINGLNMVKLIAMVHNYE